MGLEEKRKIAELQTTVIPDIQKKIEALMGASVPIEGDWATFTDDNSLNSLKVSVLPSLVDAIKAVAADALGKDALKAALKKVVFKKVPISSGDKATFADGVLTNASTYNGTYAGMGDMRKALHDGL